MNRLFIIEDERHAEPQGEFLTAAAVLAELERRAALSSDEPPNRPPCMSWRTCGRQYDVVEFDPVNRSEISRYTVLEVAPNEVKWHESGRGRLERDRE